jgi:hypothetical protein
MLEVTQHKRSNSDIVKVLIDNVTLSIKINASMLSIQDIHDHVAKYTIPESWRNKNYIFDLTSALTASGWR